MRNSPKKRNSKLVLAILLGLVCCLTGCAKEPVEQPDTTDYSYVAEKYNKRVSNAEGMNLYSVVQGEITSVGEIIGAYPVDLASESSKNYIRLKDSDYYVKAEDCTEDWHWYRYHNHYAMQQENIRTNDSYMLYNEQNQPVMQMHVSAEYPLYVQETTRYGVDIQSRILYVNKEDVSERITTTRTTENAKDVPVLMYHFFYDEATDTQPKDGNYLSNTKLSEQLNYLQENGYQAVTMRELYHYLKEEAYLPEKSVAITIDDGSSTVHEYAYPIFKQYDTNATLFLIGGWLDPILPYEFVEMREDGLELQSHSFLMHTEGCKEGHGGKLLCVDHAEGVEDTKMSLDYVDGGFVYCYPFGDVNDHAVAILQETNVKMAFTTKNGRVAPGMDLYRLPRVRVSGNTSLQAFAGSID